MEEWGFEISLDEIPGTGQGGGIELNAPKLLQKFPDEPSM